MALSKEQWPPHDSWEVADVPLCLVLPNRSSLEGRSAEGDRRVATLSEGEEGEVSGNFPPISLLIWPHRGQKFSLSLPLLSEDERRRIVCPLLFFLLAQTGRDFSGDKATWVDVASRAQVRLLEDAGQMGCQGGALNMSPSLRELAEM